MDAGVASGQPAGQRAPHRHRRQGCRNTQPPTADGSEFLHYFAHPLLPQLLPTLYPGVFPNLAEYNSGSPNSRPDIEAIFLTGIPAGVITQAPSFTNYNGTGVKADMLRLNTAIPPSSSPNNLGLLGLDVAGYPNGRRVVDDVATIALRAVAGATLGYVVPSFTADGAAGVVDFGLTAVGPTSRRMARSSYLSVPLPGHAVQWVLEPRRDPGLGGSVGPWTTTREPAKWDPSSSTSAATGRRHCAHAAEPRRSEIEIRRCGTAWDGTHVAVRPRRIPGGLVYAALFPELRQGDYEVRLRGGVPDGTAATVSVHGGRVSQAHLNPTAA